MFMVRGRTVNYSKNARCKIKCDARQGNHDKPRHVVKIVTAGGQIIVVHLEMYLSNSNNNKLLDFTISSSSKGAIISEVFIIAACVPATTVIYCILLLSESQLGHGVCLLHSDVQRKIR